MGFALYYWFAAQGIAAELAWGSLGRDFIRIAAGGLLLGWAWNAHSRLRGRRRAVG